MIHRYRRSVHHRPSIRLRRWYDTTMTITLSAAILNSRELFHPISQIIETFNSYNNIMVSVLSTMSMSKRGKASLLVSISMSICCCTVHDHQPSSYHLNSHLSCAYPYVSLSSSSSSLLSSSISLPTVHNNNIRHYYHIRRGHHHPHQRRCHRPHRLRRTRHGRQYLPRQLSRRTTNLRKW